MGATARSPWRLLLTTALVIAALWVPSGPAAGQVPTPTPGGECCEQHGGAGCDVAACEECVCADDEFCCLSRWDDICVGLADSASCQDVCQCDQLPVATPTPGGNCCSDHGGPGCDVGACQECVCNIDNLCCTTRWDATCVSEAQVECAESCPCGPLPTETPAPTPTPGGDCCAAHEGPSCDDNACRACVCAIDSACCSVIWDATCASEASQECALECPCESAGDCCEPHGGVGCNDATCKDCVCEVDEACCTDGEGWDLRCVEEANVECAASCTCEVAGTCCEEHPETLGCDDRRCQDCVCTFDPACCAEGWDARCAEEAAVECDDRCAECGVSDCCEEREDAGCSNDACEVCVCDTDDFCCNEVWDGTCVDIASDACVNDCLCGGSGSCPGDCGDDGDVTVNELIVAVNIALGNSPISACPAVDTDGNGQVAVNELVQAVNAALNGC